VIERQKIAKYLERRLWRKHFWRC